MSITTMSDAGREAALLFPGSNLWSRIQRLRPRICPFHELITRLPSDATVLDIGCGSGLFLGLAAADGRIKEGVGFDMSANAIRAAELMNAKLSGPKRLKFIEQGAADAWPEGTYDVVSMIDVMHHLPREVRKPVLLQAVQKLKPGGIFIYKDMVDSPLWRATANRAHDLVMAREWIRYEPLEDVEAFLAANGMEIRERSTHNLLWYGHELLVSRKPA